MGGSPRTEAEADAAPGIKRKLSIRRTRSPLDSQATHSHQPQFQRKKAPTVTTMSTLLCLALGSYMVTFSMSSGTGEKRTLRVPDLGFLGSNSRIVLSCSSVTMTVLFEDFLPGLDFPLFSGLNQQSFVAWFARPQCVHFLYLDCCLEISDLSLFLLP